MKQLFDSSALSMVALSGGIIFAYCQDADDSHMSVAYKHASFEDGTMTNVTADYFATAKFGGKYRSILFQTDNPITCKVVHLPDGNIFIADDKGQAKIVSPEIETLWSNTFTHKGNIISGAVAYENSLWCAFKDSGTLVRYNIRTMRDELRIGGGANTAILAPKGLYINGDVLRICDAGSNKLIDVDLKTYATNVYYEFDEPIHQYITVKGYEFVLLDSGIYVL